MELKPHLMDITDRFIGSRRCQSVDPTGRFQCHGRLNHHGAGHAGPHAHDVGLPSWRDQHLVDIVRWEDDSVPTGGTHVEWSDPFKQCDETCTSDCGHCKGRRFGPFADPDPGDERGGQVVTAWLVVAVGLAVALLVCLALVWLVRR